MLVVIYAADTQLAALAIFSLCLLVRAAAWFDQERQRRSIISLIKEKPNLKAPTMRNGSPQSIPIDQLVPGGVIQLEEENIVPADGRLLASDGTFCLSQAHITNEKPDTWKRQGDFVFATSTVKRGNAFMEIAETGDRTFSGRLASEDPGPPFGLSKPPEGYLTDLLSGVFIVLLSLATLIISSLCVWGSLTVSGMVVFSTGILLVSVPVGLTANVIAVLIGTTTALGVSGVIIRKFSALEDLAGIDVLVVDKTGTIIQNQMLLQEPFAATPDIQRKDLLLTAGLTLPPNMNRLDTIDKAILGVLGKNAEVNNEVSRYRVTHHIPFDPDSKQIGAICKSPEGIITTHIRGAHLFVLKTVTDGSSVATEAQARYRNAVKDLASKGLKVFGVARKKQGSTWEILGLLPCMDPVRHDTLANVQLARLLGVRVKMVTHDAAGIVEHTAHQLGMKAGILPAHDLGLGTADYPITPEAEVLLDRMDGVAEAFPQHKFNVVHVLRRRGYRVGVTGDSLNDRPTFLQADVSIAVQGVANGARAASEIVLLQLGLGPIIKALISARQVVHLLYSEIQYYIAISLHLQSIFWLSSTALRMPLDSRLVLLLVVFPDSPHWPSLRCTPGTL
ncbi:hypothetical protein ACJ41O_015345 [Fusarium nematophilum]